jgi:hypothetical protein
MDFFNLIICLVVVGLTISGTACRVSSSHVLILGQVCSQLKKIGLVLGKGANVHNKQLANNVLFD